MSLGCCTGFAEAQDRTPSFLSASNTLDSNIQSVHPLGLQQCVEDYYGSKSVKLLWQGSVS